MYPNKGGQGGFRPFGQRAMLVESPEDQCPELNPEDLDANLMSLLKIDKQRMQQGWDN